MEAESERQRAQRNVDDSSRGIKTSGDDILPFLQLAKHLNLCYYLM